MKIGPALWAVALLWSAVAAGAEGPRFFAMDTGTHDATHRTPDEQAALAAEVGFDGVGPTYTTPEALGQWLAALDRRHLPLVTLYLHLDLDAAAAAGPDIRDAIRQLRGRGTVLWLYVTSERWGKSDPAGDVRAVAALREVADLVREAGLRLTLYPHTGYWLERIEDAVRVARQVNRDDVGVSFNLCHWLKAGGGDIDAVVDLARPHLSVVTINGADTQGTDWARLIQPLDRGDFDVARLLAALDRVGFRGPVGLQHFGIGGDARANLGRSLAAWRGLQARELLAPGRALAAWEEAAGWREVGAVRPDPRQPNRWTTEPGVGVLVSDGGAGYLCSREKLADLAVRVEFMIPRGSNSGVYCLGSHEVQVYDSFGVARGEYPGIECGGIYPEWIGNANVRGHAPRTNASRPPGEWQVFDVIYRAPRFDAAGGKLRNARFEKVWHNGVLVQEDVELFGPTRVGLPEAAAGPLRLQGDHGPVAYRNIRVRTLKAGR